MPADKCRKILVVDDEEFVLSALRRSLRREGHEVFTAQSPQAALEILAANPVDLVISDHLMPTMTGLEFLKLVRTRYPDTMRIMLTGHADMDTVVGAINHGEIYRFLTKPWDDTELKVMLFIAFEQLDLERENRRLLAMVRRQATLIETLEEQFPGINALVRDPNGVIVLDEEEDGSATLRRASA